MAEGPSIVLCKEAVGHFATKEVTAVRRNSTRSVNDVRYSLAAFIVFIPVIFSAYGQDMPGMKMDSSAVKKEGIKAGLHQIMLPMPFFTHMGIPYNVRTFVLDAAVLPTINDGVVTANYNFQFMTGLSKTVGLFIGGEDLADDPTLEAMFQFLVWESKNGMHGISPIIEFEFPFGEDAAYSVYTLVGIASTFSNPHVAFNQVLHYSPLEELAEGSVSILVKASKWIFPVAEFSGVVAKSACPIFNLLAGVKIQVNKYLLLGFAYQFPLTTNRDYSYRFVFQPNLFIQN